MARPGIEPRTSDESGVLPAVLRGPAISLGMFRKGKTCIIAKLHHTEIFICSHSREENTTSHSRINAVFRKYC